MPEIQYPKNPNSDTAFVVQEDGTKNRALMTAPQDTSSLELPTNSNSCKGYVTVDGKKQRVILTADIGSGGGGGSVDKNKIINKATSLPTASASNAGQAYMYDGADTEDYTHGYIYQSQPTYTDPSATISQTVGSDSISFETISGNTTISGDMQAFNELLASIGWTQSDVPSTGTLEFKWERADDAWYLTLPLSGWSDLYTQNFLEEMGFVFTGTPASGDKITATYRFGLTDLSVNLNTFVEAEQPSGSETVSFVSGGSQDIPEVLYGENGGFSCRIVDPSLFVSQVDDYWNSVGFGTSATSYGIGVIPAGADNEVSIWVFDGEGNSGGTGIAIANAGAWGLSVEGPQTTVSDTIKLIAPRKSLHTVSDIWSKNGTTVDLADYGISYSGTPANGDTLTVVYTASSISGYAWNQINVQPGGSEGIKWTGQWDKPADMQYYWYCAGFDFAILPAGTYEFYFQNKQQWGDVANSAVWGAKTWRATFFVAGEGDSRQVSGTLAWVLDGQTTLGSYNLSTDARCYYTTDKTTKDRIATVVSQTTGMVITTGEQQSVVPDLFRWTNIKNIDTGVEYPVTVNIVQDNTPQLGYNLGGITSGSAVNQPERAVYQRVFEAGFNNNQQRFVLGSAYDANETRTGSFAECDLEMVTANGHYRAKITNYIRSSVLLVYEASGDLANVQIGTLDESELQIMLNTPTDTTGTIQAVVSVSGSSNYFYLNGLYEPWTLTRVLTPTKIGGTVTPENFGMILQYDGTTDANYTNGYFYKAAGTVVTTPESITTTVLNYPGEATVTIDVTNWINALQTFIGWSGEQIREWLNNYGASDWNVNYDADNDSITRMYLPWYGDITEASILQWVSVTYTGSEEGTFDILFNETYTAEHTEIQNGHWERIDVQPSSGGSSYTAGTGIDITSGVISVKTPVTSTGVGGLTAGDGYSTMDSQQWITRFGRGTQTTGAGSSAFGNSARATGDHSTALGNSAYAYANYAIQLGMGTNSTANTFMVGLSSNSNYELLSADGTIPAARHAALPAADGTYVLKLVIANGVPTLSWVAE